MSVEQLMNVLYDIKLDKYKKIPSKYLQKSLPKKSKKSKKKKFPKDKYPIYYQITQSGGNYPTTSRYFLDKNTVSERILHIKLALQKMRNSPPPLELGIFSDTELHQDDFRDAERELLEHQQRQMNMKETWSESWMKSKFPIYCRIMTVIIKLIICILSCRKSLSQVIIKWLHDNFDILGDFFLGLLGSVQAYSRYTSLFSNVPIFGSVFRILFSLFRFLFKDIGGQVSFDIIPMLTSVMYNLINTLRPYYNTIYRYWILIQQVRNQNPTVYLSLLFSVVMIFFEKNLPEIKGVKLIRIPLLSQNLWSVFNEIIEFTTKYNFSICDWCEGKKEKLILSGVNSKTKKVLDDATNKVIQKLDPELSLGETLAKASIPSNNNIYNYFLKRKDYLQEELSKTNQIIKNSNKPDSEGFTRLERMEIDRVRESPLSVMGLNQPKYKGKMTGGSQFTKKKKKKLK